MYWSPVHGLAGAFGATISRVGAKILVDFTANIHMRHPNEMGCVYWAFTRLSTPIICFYFGSRYLSCMESDAGNARGLGMVLNAEQV